MIVVPWARNDLPETDDDEDARRIFTKDFSHMFSKAVGDIVSPIDTIYNNSGIVYLCHRVHLISHLTSLCLWQYITDKEYIELYQKENCDIISWWTENNLSPENLKK